MADNQQKNTQQSGSSFGSKVLIKLQPHKGKIALFFVILIIAALVISLILFGWKTVITFILTYLSIIAVIVAFVIIIIWGFRDDNEGSKYIAVAFLIWGIDMLPALPYLGRPYAGFEFDVAATLNTNWVAIVVFLVPAFAFGVFRDFFKRNYWAAFIGFVIVKLIGGFSEIFSGYNVQLKYINWVLFGMIVLVFVLAMFYRENLSESIVDYLTYVFMILVLGFFWINDFWMSVPRAWLHVGFILVFGFVYMRKEERGNPSVWHILIPAFLIADFFVYNLLWLGQDVANLLQFFPVLVPLVLWYCKDKAQDTTYTSFAIGFIFMIILFSAMPAWAVDSESALFQARKGTDYKEFFSQFGDRIKEVITGRLDIATAGLYTGNVEKNRYENLGVYFSNIRAADPRFYIDDPITIWGSIRSKTYKDAVIVGFNCSRWKDSKRIHADKIIPGIKFPIFTLDEVDTECTFYPDNDNPIKPGPNTITLSAEYNFGTDAYLKAYFIDRDRLRAYSREDVDPLTEFGIKDKNPIAVFTNGPVEIGIDTSSPLITVSRGYTIKPSIGITLTNRKELKDEEKRIISKWDGKIKNITELILLVPPGIEISNLDDCKSKEEEKKINCPCSMPFKEYKKGQCYISCDAHVLKPCQDSCKHISTDEKEREKCRVECVEPFNKCKAECDVLFQAGANPAKEEYKAYALEVNSLEFKDLNKDIDKHRSFQCRFDPSTSVLDNTPITTRYFRVRARYNYLLENSVQVNVEVPVTPQGETAPESLIRTALDFKSRYGGGIDPDLIMALAYVESGLRHCCREAGKTGSGTCTGSDQKKCPENRIINSGTSIGIMQVRYYSKDPALQKKIQDEVDERVKRLCENGDTIFDFDCNVKVGLDILAEKYSSYKNGCKEASEYKSPNIKSACDTCLSSKGIRYDSYKGAYAALRGYNGWGCDSRFDKDYVEKVNNALEKIKNGKIVDETGIRNLFSSRTGEGMVYDAAN